MRYAQDASTADKILDKSTHHIKLADTIIGVAWLLIRTRKIIRPIKERMGPSKHSTVNLQILKSS